MHRPQPAIVFACFIAIASAASAQSLADIAKKTADDRAAAADKKKADDKAAPKTTFTNADLKDVSMLYPSALPADQAAAIAAGPATLAAPGASEQSEDDRQAEYRKSAKKDEAYWKGLMRSLRTKLSDDRAFYASAITREQTLSKRLHRSVDDIQYIRDRIVRADVEVQWNDAVTEVSRLKALVANDQRAIDTAELDAHAAGVPPGWLVVP